VRWLPSTTENASGPPHFRSAHGNEILEADIHVLPQT
jgi:hypothetical protein